MLSKNLEIKTIIKKMNKSQFNNKKINNKI